MEMENHWGISIFSSDKRVNYCAVRKFMQRLTTSTNLTVYVKNYSLAILIHLHRFYKMLWTLY